MVKICGVDIVKETVTVAILELDHAFVGHERLLILLEKTDEGHVHRVVYEVRQGHIWNVTTYPGRKSQYEKD